MVDGLPGENMKEMRVNDEQIGDSFPTYVVAEAGLNHNGDVETAKKASTMIFSKMLNYHLKNLKNLRNILII